MQEAVITFAEILSGARIIYLKKGKVAFVDWEDYPDISQFKWFFWGKKYVGRNKSRSENNGRLGAEMMHLRILRPPPGMKCDHINLNKLDNRRHNLRLATNSQNGANVKKSRSNTSGYKGVR